MKSFLQTQEWLKLQSFIGRKTFSYNNGKIKANIIQHDLPLGKNYLYVPHGPEIYFDDISGSIKNELAQFVAYLKNIAREEKSIFIKIEPLDDKVIELLYNFGFKKSSKEIQPQRSVIIDLYKSEKELLSEMHHKTRYNIKVAERSNIIVKDSSDLDVFLKLLNKTAKRDRFGTHEEGYYKKLISFFREGPIKTDLILASVGGKPVAGALVLSAGDTCYYLHGASDHNFRAMMAPYALHWENIKYLKGRNLGHYDFWGIDAKRWPGVTRFKLGFGGREVEYPGSFDLPISKIWYLIYKIMRKLF
jgi:lipid II:glycine glycyltransferase (peptidoglycan interpeptide bridge formation enzyme)